MGSAHHTENQGAKRTAQQAQGSLSTLCVSACRAGDQIDKSDSTGLGQLFSGWAFQSVFCLCEGLGGEEDTAASDASTKTQRLRLEQVE